MKTKEIKKFRDTYTKYEKECVFEGYQLAVLFDEKDMIKKHGGRWDADKQTWWMPEKHLLTDVHAGIGTVRDVLNDHEMVMGPYGEFKGKKSIMDNKSHEGYMLRNDLLKYVITWYPNQDAVEFVGPYNSNNVVTTWNTVEDAKTRWNELIDEGYNRVD